MDSKSVSISITDRDCGEQSLWHVGDDNSDEEDDGVEPVVAEDEGDDEERDAEEHCYTGDEVDEVLDLPWYRCLPHLQTWRQVSDAAHHRAVTGEDHETAACTWQPIRRQFNGRPLLLKV